MKRKIASTLLALGTPLILCAQDLSNIALTSKEDSVTYANTYLSFDSYQKDNPEEYNKIISYSDAFVSTIRTTYHGIQSRQNETEIKKGIAKKITDDDSREVVEIAMLMGASSSGKNHNGAVFLRSLCDRISGDTTLSWKKEDMISFLANIEKEKAEEAGKLKATNANLWNDLVKKEGYTEITTTDEGVASDLDYEGRGVLIKTDKKGKGDKISLKDTVVIQYSMSLLDGTAVCKGNRVNVIPDYVMNGLCAALINMKEGAKATIYIPEGLGYRDDVIFVDPLKADRKKVENKGLKMEVEVLSVMSK